MEYYVITTCWKDNLTAHSK